MNAMDSLGMNDNTILQNDYAVKNSVILEDGNERTPHEPRHSIENHSSSTDLMAHMHGLTPCPKPSFRRNRLSTGSAATNGTCSKYSAASPFPPAPLSTLGKNSQTKCLTHEFVETPMMKPLGWGSCPVEGRDWGASAECEEEITQELSNRLHQALLESGMLTLFILVVLSSGAADWLPLCAGKLDELKELSDHEPKPFSLELELEAQGDDGVNESSPESISKHEYRDGVFFPQDAIFESSPSSQGCFEKMDTGVDFLVGQSEDDARAFRRRQTGFAKRKRMSLFASAVNPAASILNNRKSLFVRAPKASAVASPLPILNKNLIVEHKFEVEMRTEAMVENLAVGIPNWLKQNDLLKSIFAFLSEPELLRSASLVCTKWADIATEALAKLMLTSVGCKGILGGETQENDDVSCCEDDDSPGLLDKPWSHLISTFPWARFLAEGGFKKVFKVFNRNHRIYEAVSVM